MRRLGNVVTLLAIIGCGAVAQQASAATINVACGDVTGLRNAITDANATAGADTIEIADASPCTFSLTNPVDPAAGGIGLPIVTAPLTVNGHGATIERSGAAVAPFRILAVTNTQLVLNELSIGGGRLTGSGQGGGAVLSFIGDLRLNDVTLTFNAANGPGGAIHAIGGQAHLNRALLALNTGSTGGGMHATSATGTVRATTFLSNSATSGAGMQQAGGTWTYENVTFANNRASNAIGGLAVLNSGTDSGVADVASSTFADNGGSGTQPGTALFTLASGGGTATINVTDTIVTDNDSTAPATSPPCNTVFGGAIVDGGGNIEWPHNTCGFGTNADPKMSSIGQHSGVWLYRPLPGSPAIDLGGASCPTTDARGEPRPEGEACDAGAYETNPPQTTTDGPAQPTNAPSITLTSDEANSTFECRVVGEGDFSACTSPYQPTLGTGTHTVEVRAIDADGYVDATPASVTFTVDATPPDTTITGGPTGTVHSTNPTTTQTWTFTSEAGATFECRLDNAAFAAVHVPEDDRRHRPGHAHVRGPRDRRRRQRRPDAGDTHVHVPALQPALRRAGPARQTDHRLSLAPTPRSGLSVNTPSTPAARQRRSSPAMSASSARKTHVWTARPAACASATSRSSTTEKCGPIAAA